MPNPVVHFEIVGRDGPALQKFYADAFGWKVDAANPMNYGMVDNGGEGINGGISGGEKPEDSWVTVYIQVDDLDAALVKIEAAGGKTVQPPLEIPGVVTMALFNDPDGHLVGLVKS
jgi:predicted enzyme related to lactoylglutathione lyase